MQVYPRNMNYARFCIFSSIVLMLLTSCKSDDVVYSYPDDPAYIRRNRAGKLWKSDIVLYSKEDSKKKHDHEIGKTEGMVKNDPRWAISAEVLSELFPIENIDGDLGIITTSWHGSGNDRVRINLIVRSTSDTPRNLSQSGEGKQSSERCDTFDEFVRISVFKQTLKNGVWIDVAEGSTKTAEKLRKLIQSRCITRLHDK